MVCFAAFPPWIGFDCTGELSAGAGAGRSRRWGVRAAAMRDRPASRTFCNK